MTHGRFVEYRLEYGPSAGQYRPALVVRVWNDSCAQLQVFADKMNDGPDPYGVDWFRSSVSLGDVPGTWRHLPSDFVFYSNSTVGRPVFPMIQNDGLAPAFPTVVPALPTAAPSSYPTHESARWTLGEMVPS